MYAKLFGSVLDSSLWTAPHATRILFVTMLAMADKEGYVYASATGLRNRARITRKELAIAMATLAGPDVESSDRLRNPENDGRRIEEVPGGWKLLNYPYYRGLRDEDERREQNREAQRRFRAKQKEVSQGKPPSATVSPSEAYSDSEAYKTKKENTQRSLPFAPPSIPDVRAYAAEKHLNVDPVAFVAYYESIGWKVGKNPMKKWKAAVWTWSRKENR